jgi:hypothetical protein
MTPAVIRIWCHVCERDLLADVPGAPTTVSAAAARRIMLNHVAAFPEHASIELAYEGQGPG